MRSFSPRRLVAACALGSAALSTALGWGLIRSAAATYDEPVHLAAGYLALKETGRPINYLDHPLFAEMWSALPLLALRPATLVGHAQRGRLYNFADAFLYQNRVPAERMLDAARLWSLASWSLILALAACAWAFRLGGVAAAAFAALLLGLCPPLFSNAALVSTDMAAAAFFFIPFWLLSDPERKARHWLGAGLAVGLALGSKFSMIALPPVLVAVALSDARARKAAPPAGAALLALGCAALALAALYRFEAGLWREGLSATLSRLGEGRASYMAGRHSTTGNFWYFPLALLLKTPLSLLALAALGLWSWLRRPGQELLWCALPPAAYFAAACLSKTQIGYRHILPVYPFLVLAGGCAAARLWEQGRARRAGALSLCAWAALSVLRVHPHHLAYFNELVGGPSQGHRWLVDSNLDWGQGLKELAAELSRRGNPAIFLSYFGVADPSYYGIRYHPVGFVSNVERRDGVVAPAPGRELWLAVSATNLRGVYYRDKQAFSWLESRTPAFVAGHSIFVYELGADLDARRRLAAIVEGEGARELARGLIQ